MAIKLEVRAETIDALEKRVLAAFPLARRYGDDGSGRSWASKYIAIAALRHRDQDDLWIVVIRTPLLGLLTVVFLAAACYGAWLMYDGLPIVMGIEKERAVMYAGALLTVALVILVSTRVGSVILWNFGVGPVFISG